MFVHEGAERSASQNAMLAGYLAFIAGFVNSGGFVLIGSFTSHVTGNIGRFGHDVAVGTPAAAVFAVLLVASFFAGAFGASLILESHGEDRARGYAIALLAEALLLGTFVFVAGLSRATHPRLLDAEAGILSLAMGMQNSLITRLSGAVVRTTHLTGVVTDLGIETARWYRWHRAKLGRVVGGKPERPASARIVLHLTLVLAFMVGTIIGATVTTHASRWAMAVPAIAVLAASIRAFRGVRSKPGSN
ncbi:MAG: putative transrane protein [Myxococcaceae bacterium]|nr:putative transrane protein [Myxococcaceae bacterium]